MNTNKEAHMSKIYLASSWRNPYQPEVLKTLREAGHKVYDFRHPEPGNEGFSWRQTTADWKPGEKTSLPKLVDALRHPVAIKGFHLDFAAMLGCDTTVCLLPCGNSAHLELGHAAGAKRRSIVYAPPEAMIEPELMYLCCTSICTSMDELLEVLKKPVSLPNPYNYTRRFRDPEPGDGLPDPWFGETDDGAP